MAEPTFRPYPNLYSDDCYQVKNHDESELCAEWRSALSSEKAAHEARRAAIFAVISTILSGAAVFGLIVTILQGRKGFDLARRGNLAAMKENARSTRRAIESAKVTAQTLDHAAASARAAEQQVKIASDTAQKQLRAYVDFHGIKAERLDGLVTYAKTSIRNFGQTPANNLFIKYRYSFGIYGKLQTGSDEKEQALGIIAPADESVTYISVRLDNRATQLFDSQDLIIYLDLRVEYDDIFDKPHFVAATYYSGPGGVFVVENGTRIAS